MTSTRALEPLLAVSGLNVDFFVAGKTKRIVSDLSFTLQAGRTLGMVGESGSGKTVTAKSILNLIPTPPLQNIEGEICFRGDNLLNLPPRKMSAVRGREISFIFQEPMTALNPVLSVGKQIMEMIQRHESVGRKEARERTIALLHETGLSDPVQRLGSYPHELSGGMRQRVMIAMAISCNPRLIIADEPTTALDVTIQAQILELFRSILENRNTAIIFVTHDLGVIAEIADDVLVIQQGKVVEYNQVAEIFHHPRHPYTRGLLNLLQRRKEQ